MALLMFLVACSSGQPVIPDSDKAVGIFRESARLGMRFALHRTPQAALINVLVRPHRLPESDMSV